MTEFIEEKKTLKAAGMIIYAEMENRFLVLSRNKWEGEGTPFLVPGGKLEQGETFLGAAIRETYEETGIRISSSFPRYIPFLDSSTKWTNEARMFLYRITSMGMIKIKLEPNKFSGYLWLPLSDKKLLTQYLPSCMPGLKKFIINYLLCESKKHWSNISSYALVRDVKNYG